MTTAIDLPEAPVEPVLISDDVVPGGPFTDVLRDFAPVGDTSGPELLPDAPPFPGAGGGYVSALTDLPYPAGGAPAGNLPSPEPVGGLKPIPPAVSAAPEPSAWLLMMTGFSAAGLMLRRPRKGKYG